MHKVLHQRHDIDSMSQENKEGEEALETAWIQGLKDYIKKNKERLITVANNITDNIRTNRMTITRKQKCNPPPPPKKKNEQNNGTAISRDKLAISHWRRPGHRYRRETLREKLNLFK